MAFLTGVKRSFNSTISFFVDSWSELKKVRWPNRKELISYTIVVVLTVIFITVYFALLDLGFSSILRWLFS
ncbi:MAG TPA: preprotein translocase subunit SecE [Bacilli bacterium]